MSNYQQQRLVAERAELRVKISSLKRIITNPAFEDRDKVDRRLLPEQLIYMEGYRRVLDNRISHAMADSA